MEDLLIRRNLRTKLFYLDHFEESLNSDCSGHSCNTSKKKLYTLPRYKKLALEASTNFKPNTIFSETHKKFYSKIDNQLLKENQKLKDTNQTTQSFYQSSVDKNDHKSKVSKDAKEDFQKTQQEVYNLTFSK